MIKKEFVSVKTKSKNPTTNYEKDTHKVFCKRCKAFNNGCPSENPHECNL